MCELLAVAAEQPISLGTVLDWARRLEVMGFAGYGWGVAWTDADGLQLYKNPSSLADDVAGAARVEVIQAARVLIHLRRPNDPSTVTSADTQPFLDEARSFAFCHNGLFRLADSFRDQLSGQLHGRADSEVGFRLVERALRSGMSPAVSLAEVHQQLTGTANCGFLSRDGELLVYHSFAQNPVWSLMQHGARVLVTGSHWSDDSGLRRLFPNSDSAQRVQEGRTVLASSIEPVAHSQG